MDSFVWRHVGRSGSNEMPLFIIRSGRRNGWKEIPHLVELRRREVYDPQPFGLSSESVDPSSTSKCTMKAALWAEAVKLAASTVARVASVAIAAGITVLSGAMLLAASSSDPQLLAKLGPAATRDWMGFLLAAAQITGAGGTAQPGSRGHSATPALDGQRRRAVPPTFARNALPRRSTLRVPGR